MALYFGNNKFDCAVLPTQSSEIIEYNQIADSVKQYLKASKVYSSSDYSVSVVDSYTPSSSGQTLEYWPKGAQIGSTTYYNEEPNKFNPVCNDEGSDNGIIKPTGFLRWLRTSARNARDIGGWSCDGGTIKYNKIIRGGIVDSSAIPVIVNKIGCNLDIDLRGTEVSDESSPLGIHYYRNTNYAWYSLNSAGIIPNMNKLFEAILHGDSVYIHCTGGADRTGTLLCIIEAILGMDQTDIDRDYELTSFYFGNQSDEYSRRRNESDWTGLINQITSLSVGSTFRDKVVNWLVQNGISIDDINKFRKL